MYKKKITKILIGTNNIGKFKEIKDLLPKKVRIFSPVSLKIRSPKETGKSFQENSYLKAEYFSKKSGMICLSDDSGLEIDILNKEPGIYSARWGGKKNNFNIAIQKVFRKLYFKKKKLKKKKIYARFICALTIYWPKGKSITKLGKIEGTISKVKKGKNGFGYDPIFIPKGKILTFGQMKPHLKYKIDHRFNAFNKIKKFF